MADINYNPNNFNHGIPPEPGLVWNGESWGWVTRGYDIPPIADGYQNLIPSEIRPEIRTAINQVKQAHDHDSLMSVDFWKLRPAYDWPHQKNTISPVFIMLPAKEVTDIELPTMSVAPEKIPVHSRILDEVHDGAQYISVSGSASRSYELPVFKTTSTRDPLSFFRVFTRSIKFI